MRKNSFILLLILITTGGYAQSIYNSAQIGQTGRNQNVSRGLWVKADTFLLTSTFWLPANGGAGKVLTSDANGFGTWQSISASAWSLTGNTSTDPATNFIGTTDNVPLILKSNGRIHAVFGTLASLSDSSVALLGDTITLIAPYFKWVNGTGSADNGKVATNANGFFIWVNLDTTIVSSAASITLNIDVKTSNYSFSGTTTTWTLPAVSGTSGKVIRIKNRGSGDITLNANGGANEIYNTSAINSFAITAGSAYMLVTS